jgi:uncharacterized membrane protein YkvI
MAACGMSEPANNPSGAGASAPGLLKRYLLPGFVFQSVVIAGGYGTGRELAEFFLPYGPKGGLLAMMLVSMTFWSLVCAVAFEYARVFQAYDYRTFCRYLLGRGWVVFELTYAALMMIVLAVIASASGSILQETFGLPYLVGVIGIMLVIGFLVFEGTELIEKVLASWSVVLYATFIVLFVWSLSAFSTEIGTALSTEPVGDGWFLGGIEYAAYNVAMIPALLFGVRHVKTRKEALISGGLTGPIAILPGFFLLLAMAGHYPAIADETVPVNMILEGLGSRTFQIVFQICLFGTLIETGTGLIHGVNERLAMTFKESGKELPPRMRPVIAVTLLVIGALLAQFGLIGLIARGYGTLTWIFLVVVLVPLLTWGVWQLIRADQSKLDWDPDYDYKSERSRT